MLICTRSAWGQPIAQPITQPITQGDPLELTRVAERRGEAALLVAITNGDVQAVRAAGFARSPEVLLARLGEIAAGDDPRRAPAAAFAGHRLAADLDARQLDRNEADRSELQAALAPWTALIQDETARVDLRLLAGVVVSALTEVLAER